jgi:hypothetical protein
LSSISHSAPQSAVRVSPEAAPPGQTHNFSFSSLLRLRLQACRPGAVRASARVSCRHERAFQPRRWLPRRRFSRLSSPNRAAVSPFFSASARVLQARRRPCSFFALDSPTRFGSFESWARVCAPPPCCFPSRVLGFGATAGASFFRVSRSWLSCSAKARASVSPHEPGVLSSVL